jgi:ABC-type Fe3+-siderophore transport system permease subunit
VIGPTGLGIGIGGGLGFVQGVSRSSVAIPALSSPALALLGAVLGAFSLAVLARRRRTHR